VLYGPTAAYGNFSGTSAAAELNHRVLLTGLTPSSTNYFSALSFVGTTVYATNGSFTTTSTNAIILSTQDAILKGNWTAGVAATGSYTNGYYQSAITFPSNTPSAWATYAPNIPAAGLYTVSMWHPQNPGFSTNAQVVIFGATNTLTVPVDETTNGGQWVTLAQNFYFTAGTNGNVTLYNDTGETNKTVVANAMMWGYNTASPTNGSVPTWWANFYFPTNNGYVSGTADPDGDGYDNFSEYVFGTDPTDATSHLVFTVTPGLSNTVSITFSPCQGGRAYQLQSAAALPPAAWTTLTNGYTVNTNGSGTFTVGQTNAASAFYRLSAQVVQ
jgi:hypothetical protein